MNVLRWDRKAGLPAKVSVSPAISNGGSKATLNVILRQRVIDRRRPAHYIGLGRGSYLAIMGPVGDELSDCSLLKLVQEHDQQALATLYKRYSSLIYSIALRILKNPMAAEDLVQEIFLQLWRSPEKITPIAEDLHGWMIIASRNRSISLLRKKQLDPLGDLILVAPGDFRKHLDLRLACEALICTLQAEQKTLLEMAFLQEMSHTEIAAATGHPLGTIKTRIRTALLALKRTVITTEEASEHESSTILLKPAV